VEEEIALVCSMRRKSPAGYRMSRLSVATVLVVVFDFVFVVARISTEKHPRAGCVSPVVNVCPSCIAGLRVSIITVPGYYSNKTAR